MSHSKPYYVISMVMVTLSTVMLVANQKSLALYGLPAGIIPGVLLIIAAMYLAIKHGLMRLSQIFLFLIIAGIVENLIFRLAVSLPAEGKWPYQAMYAQILTITHHQFILDLLCVALIYVISLLVGRLVRKDNNETSGKPRYKYYPIIGMTFVFVLLISNITTQKVVHVWDIVVDVGTFYFPVTYIFNNIFTEVYGYAASRKLIWTGLMCNILMIALLQLIVYLPANPDWHGQFAFKMIAGDVPRIVIASIVAFFCGEFLNSYVLAKMKILTKGKLLFTRTIGSTVVGNAADSLAFNLFAFLFIIPLGVVFQVAAWQYALKVGYEILATPITYLIVLTLKRKEKEDHYDIGTNFNPFIIED